MLIKRFQNNCVQRPRGVISVISTVCVSAAPHLLLPGPQVHLVPLLHLLVPARLRRNRQPLVLVLEARVEALPLLGHVGQLGGVAAVHLTVRRIRRRRPSKPAV